MNTLEHKGYYGSVEYDKDHKCYCGKVLGMTHDSITYEGSSEEELKEDFRAGIDSYLEGCKELGIKPRKGYSGTLNIRIPPAVYSNISAYAERNKTTVNVFVRNLIERQMATAF